MTVTKLSTNRVRLSSDTGLLYVPSDKQYRVIECLCGMIENVEEVAEASNEIAELLVI